METSPAIEIMAQKIIHRHGDAVLAVLYYGSCFRKKDDSDGMADLYVLVDDYRHAYARTTLAVLNRLLPPNVFHIEVPYNHERRVSKYAIFSFQDFLDGASHWFHSYLWARLAQPMGLVYVCNHQVKEEIYMAMANAVTTFVSRVLPCMPQRFNARTLWCNGLRLSYGAELRSERKDKLSVLFDAAPQYYEELTGVVMNSIPYLVKTETDAPGLYYHTNISGTKRLFCRISWQVRRIQGKFLSVLRLLKGLFTFQGGLEYILWKIERHSGIRVDMDPRLKRIPVLGMLVLFWRLYRRGAFR